MKTVRLTMARALARYLVAQSIDAPGGPKPLFAGCWIARRGNGLEPLVEAFTDMPMHHAIRAQAIAFAATGFAKASLRRRVMICLDPSGGDAGHLVAAATAAHVNRLPVLMLVVDGSVPRASGPDTVSLERFEDGAVAPVESLRAVSRYFDRVARPEQLFGALDRAIRVFTDASACGPVTLALSPDALTETHDYSERFFEPVRHRIRRPQPDIRELSAAARILERAQKPLIVAGGGVRYSEAGTVLAEFAERHGIPLCETRAGKGVVPWDNPLNMGAITRNGATAVNRLAAEADLVLAIGTRLRDFSVGDDGVFANPDLRLINLNIASHDTAKHRGLGIVADAWVGIEALDHTIANYQAPYKWREKAGIEIQEWLHAADRSLAADNALRPTIAQVVGAITRSAGKAATIVAAKQELAGELNRYGRASGVNGYHLGHADLNEGAEIAAGLGVKLARPERAVVIVTSAAGYLTGSAEIVAALQLRIGLTVIILNDGTSDGETSSGIDFAAHAASLGATSKNVIGIAQLESALARACVDEGTTVLVIETETEAGTPDDGDTGHLGE